MNARFLLTFDDGPHANTAPVLDELLHNRVQPCIKAVFFVQTRNAGGGGCREGRILLEQEHVQGHLLGLHTGTIRGHVSHTGMSPADLDRCLADGMADLRSITGDWPSLVRPPYWWFNPATVARYERHGLHMVLSDVKAYDGINCGFHLFRRLSFRRQLNEVRRRLERGEILSVGGVRPVVVAFHDTNGYTAGHLGQYLDLLIEEAGRVGLCLDDKPYYDEAPEMLRAALDRAVPPLRATSSRERRPWRNKHVPTA